MTGMEMMVQSLLKAAGFNPQEFQKDLQDFIEGFRASTNDMHARLIRVEETQLFIREQLADIANDLNTIKKELHIPETDVKRELIVYLNGKEN
jgi:hypothetical protein